MFRIKSGLFTLLVVCFAVTFTANGYAYTAQVQQVQQVQQVHVQGSVEAGANLLDKGYPGWDKRIKLAELNMKSLTRCILGQVYGHYNRGLAGLDISMYTSAKLGFTSFSDDHESFHRLRAEWKKLIKKRRDKAEQ